MKVDIGYLSQRLGLFAREQMISSSSPEANIIAEIFEALNELEAKRHDDRSWDQLNADIVKYRDMLTRKELEVERLNGIIESMRTETSPFETWFKNLHPETIESVTITLRKKEN